MTDLEIIEKAVQATLDKAHKENPGYFPVPITGFTIMEWFQIELLKAKEAAKKATALDPKGPTA